MRKLFFLLLFITLTSCTDISPKITIENDINLTIDGENIDGLEGEWIITVDEEKDDQDKSVIIIRVTKNEL
ncbi:MAG: hypothetical protein P8L83_05380 [Flavobacteriaceae bacterium]|nr:hypothetical protein [Flavobacteriaceae bacterium]